MFNFDYNINNLMHQIHAKPAIPRVIMIQKIESRFDEFKKFAAQDLMKEDNLSENSTAPHKFDVSHIPSALIFNSLVLSFRSSILIAPSQIEY